MEYRHCVCVPPAHIAPQLGFDRQRQRQIATRFNSKQWHSSVIRYMKNKQSEVSQDGWRGEQNNTAQGGYRKHEKTYWRQ